MLVSLTHRVRIMWNFGDNEFPYPSFLKVPFVFVPKGNPPPLEWMAAHPGFVTFAATFVPRSHPTPLPEAEPGAVFAPHEAPQPEAAPVQRLRDDFPDRLLEVVPPPQAQLPPPPDMRPRWLHRLLPPPADVDPSM